ncbi:MAG: hypothetical protein RBT62_05460 [Spirochaetia bacterium]|nr:hypothetical protein [Spirochaetia bacterium]
MKNKDAAIDANMKPRKIMTICFIAYGHPSFTASSSNTGKAIALASIMTGITKA